MERGDGSGCFCLTSFQLLWYLNRDIREGQRKRRASGGKNINGWWWIVTTAIHIELDALCLLILCVIVIQSIRNVNQQMSRILFRHTVYGIIGSLTLDIVWKLTDGNVFPGAVLINKTVNALYLGMGVVLGCIWYLYVLETLGFNVTGRLTRIVMTPGIVFMLLNLLSIRTEWIFRITEENVYVRGPYFRLQEIGAVGMLMISFLHILIRSLRKDDRGHRRAVRKLLGFYILPVAGTLAALPFPGMPGTWTCAAISIVLMYIDEQDREILRDSLTGLNNRKSLVNVFADYEKQAGPERRLFLFMMDLNDFKGINDTYGHAVGDEALVASAGILKESVRGRQALVCRFGGDEFLILGFFRDAGEAGEMRKNIRERFSVERRAYPLGISIGAAKYAPGKTLDGMIEEADGMLYAEKAEHHKRPARGKKTEGQKGERA